jgi:hypothetical protein
MLFSYITTYKVATLCTPYPLMPIEYIIPIVGGNERDDTLVRVLTSRIIKCKESTKESGTTI